MPSSPSSKMLCPRCGAEMNRHAEKPVEATSAETAAHVDPALGAVVYEVHTCPQCGESAMREERS